MRLIAAIAGLAGGLVGLVTTRAAIGVAFSGVPLPPFSQEDILGLIALSVCALGTAGVVLPVSSILSSVMLLAAAGAFWFFLPEYAIPAALLFLVAGVASFFDR